MDQSIASNKTRLKEGVRLYLSLVLLIASLTVWGGAKGVAQSSRPSRPEGQLSSPPNQLGFPVALSGAFLHNGSSPTLADLNNDGTLEIVIGGRDLAEGNPGCGGKVYAYRYDGSLLWETAVRAPINSTPSIADLNGDGFPDVVVSMGGFVEPTCWHGGVVALNGRSGSELWIFDTQDWLNHNPDGWLDGVYSTPAIGDINADGLLEIAFGAWDQCIYLLDRYGQPLWGNLPAILEQIRCGGHGFYNEDTIWSSPALADLTGDGRLEIIIGADISPGNVWGDPAGGYLYIFDADGNTLAREWMDQAIFSSPGVADLHGDGDYEIVVGTGTYLSGKGYYVSAFGYDANRSDPVDRLVLRWRRNTVGPVFASPAIGDLDRDGLPDVAITIGASDPEVDGSFIYAWRGFDGAKLFQRRTCNDVGQTGNTVSSPSIADVDGDGKLEILFSHLWDVTILNHDGTYYTDYSDPVWPVTPVHPGCSRDHLPSTDLTYGAGHTLYASPAVGDLDGDGDAEVAIAGHNPDNPRQGMVFVWTGHSTDGRPWPMFHRDAQHTGRTPRQPSLAVVPTLLHVLHQSGDARMEEATLLIRNNGDQPFTWSATTPSDVTLEPSSGFVATQAQVNVTINTSNHPDGNHDLGDIVMKGTLQGEPIDGSPTKIPVELYVGEVSHVFVGTIFRSHKP